MNLLTVTKPIDQNNIKQRDLNEKIYSAVIKNIPAVAVYDTIPGLKKKREINKKEQPPDIEELEMTNKMIIEQSGKINAEKEEILKAKISLTELEDELTSKTSKMSQLQKEINQLAELSAQTSLIATHTSSGIRAKELNGLQNATLARVQSEKKLQENIALIQGKLATVELRSVNELNNKLALKEKNIISLNENMIKKQSELNIVGSSMQKSVEIAEQKRISLTDEIIAELISGGLIKTDKNLSFRLNSNEFIINGIKQPAEVHNKYRNKFVQREGWNLYYDNYQ